ncbi:cation diffusion facilitator family transporter [Hippea alviniae]|uniref:cation diffusion facilitator family transporter n=1 Tax=Hippea alviniae TaxID=1279027 RepID=UPI0003B5D400|nr:cation diffusion facilitator family transporter [Hippea alviniae]
MEEKNLQKAKEFWLIASTLLNIVMAVGKLCVGVFTNTPVIIADGIHSVSDVIVSSLIYASVKLSGRKSKRFPLGMHKLEDLAALFGGLAIFYVGYEIVESVIFHSNPFVKVNIYITIPFLVAVLIAQVVFIYFELRSAKKLNSPGVNADVMEWIGDAGTTVVAIIGIVMSYFKVPYAQQVAVVIIVLAIYKEAFEIVKDAVLTLLDASVDVELIEKAKKIIVSHPKVESVDFVFIRKAGSIYVADITIKIDEKNMSRAHDLVEEIENDLKREIENLQFITIHYEPAKKSTIKTAFLLDENGNIAERLRDVARIRIEEKSVEGELLSVIEYENPFYEERRGHSIRLISWLIKKGVDEIVFSPVGQNRDRVELFESLGIRVRESI